jgi:hypothetical protein
MIGVNDRGKYLSRITARSDLMTEGIREYAEDMVRPMQPNGWIKQNKVNG